LYDYECTACASRFEEIVKIDAPMPPCPTCGGPAKKLVSAVSFALKGDGWYKDHYGLKTPKAEAAAPAPSAAAPGHTSG
jgi:putative FmdB family regulatory protein